MCGNSAYCWKTVLTLRRYGGTCDDVDALEPDLPGGRRLEAGDHAQHGRLAAARRPEHREELAAADVEVGERDRDEVAVALGDLVDRDDDGWLVGRRVGDRCSRHVRFLSDGSRPRKGAHASAPTVRAADHAATGSPASPRVVGASAAGGGRRRSAGSAGSASLPRRSPCRGCRRRSGTRVSSSARDARRARPSNQRGFSARRARVASQVRRRRRVAGVVALVDVVAEQRASGAAGRARRSAAAAASTSLLAARARAPRGAPARRRGCWRGTRARRSRRSRRTAGASRRAPRRAAAAPDARAPCGAAAA